MNTISFKNIDNMDEIIKFVQNQLVQGPFRLKSYIQDEQGKKYPQRYIYATLDKYLKDFLRGLNTQERWIIIPGLRGVGKTTIMAQLFFNYYQELDERKILYISLDEVVNILGSSLKDVLLAYEKILGESFEKLTKPIFLFIDEAQYDPQWASVLKSIHDRSHKTFIVCSGSSALSLQTNPEVARRAIFQKLFPTSFREFLMIRDRELNLKSSTKNILEILFHSESAQDVYTKLKNLEQYVLSSWALIDRHYVDEYLKIGTLPFAIHIKDEVKVYQAIGLLLDKVINQDVRNLGRFDSNTINCIKRVLFLLAESDTTSLQKLATILRTSVNTISNILDVLEQTELLIRVMPYGSNAKKVRKPSKYYFMSSAIRSTFLSVAGNEQIFTSQKGHLMEDIVVMTLYREFVTHNYGSLNYDNAKSGADLIVTIAEKNIIPIEVGVGDKTGAQIRNTMKKIGSAKYGIVICNNPLTLLKENNIIKVPLDLFLLL